MNSDLLVAMERRHLREIVTRDASAWPRTFTLKELVRRGEAVGARQPGEALGHWLGRVHAGRESRDLLGASASDDVDDPTGKPIGEHEDLAHDLDGLVERLADLLWPSPPSIAWSAN